jgi:hypothetical protein
LDSDTTPRRCPSTHDIPNHPAFQPRSESPASRRVTECTARTLDRATLETLLYIASTLRSKLFLLAISGIHPSHGHDVHLRALRLVMSDVRWPGESSLRGGETTNDDLQAWNYGSEEDWNSRPVGRVDEDNGLMSYSDMADKWSKERRVEELGSYEKILLAACRGEDDPRLLV